MTINQSSCTALYFNFTSFSKTIKMFTLIVRNAPKNCLFRAMSTVPKYDYVNVEHKGTDGRVALVSLNRPKALNALSR